MLRKPGPRLISSPAMINRWISEVPSGTTVSEMPHGGVGQSGYGSDLAIAGLLEYTPVKHAMSALR
jgi:acyl-CoA reductase-like NAD-dependent aldehyde dehydrogenase